MPQAAVRAPTGPRYLSLSRKVVRYEASDLRTFLDDRGRSNTAA